VEAESHLPRRRPSIVAATAVVVLLAACGVASYVALTNKARADRWQARSASLERNADELNALLVKRSAGLNARTRELNRMAVKVRREQAALNRSQADVASLAGRQRQLANEKAQVEDSRSQLAVQASALRSVASAFIDCKSGLEELLDDVLNDDYVSAEAILSTVSGDCQAADSTLADYNAGYGG
jgi:septal ring factor EnvC (AmiA/AmiB activator)